MDLAMTDGYKIRNLANGQHDPNFTSDGHDGGPTWFEPGGLTNWEMGQESHDLGCMGSEMPSDKLPEGSHGDDTIGVSSALGNYPSLMSRNPEGPSVEALVQRRDGLGQSLGNQGVAGFHVNVASPFTSASDQWAASSTAGHNILGRDYYSQPPLPTSQMVYPSTSDLGNYGQMLQSSSELLQPFRMTDYPCPTLTQSTPFFPTGPLLTTQTLNETHSRFSTIEQVDHMGYSGIQKRKSQPPTTAGVSRIEKKCKKAKGKKPYQPRNLPAPNLGTAGSADRSGYRGRKPINSLQERFARGVQKPACPLTWVMTNSTGTIDGQYIPTGNFYVNAQCTGPQMAAAIMDPADILFQQPPAQQRLPVQPYVGPAHPDTYSLSSYHAHSQSWYTTS